MQLAGAGAGRPQPSFGGRAAPLLLADSASLFPGVPAAGWAGLGWAGWAGLGDICRIVAVAANSGHRRPALWRHRTGGGVAGHGGGGGGVLSTAFIPHPAPCNPHSVSRTQAKDKLLNSSEPGQVTAALISNTLTEGWGGGRPDLRQPNPR